MTDPTTHLAHAIESMARVDTTPSASSTASSTTSSARLATPSKRDVDSIYDELIARLADTLATLSSDDVDTTPRSFRASPLTSKKSARQ
jgi:hypothetical protein